MNKFNLRILSIIILVASLSGCAVWTYTGEKNILWKSGKFKAELPAGWMRFASPQHQLFLTRDGSLLDSIAITKSKTNSEFPNTKRKITEDMLLQEIATLVVDEFSLDQAYKNFAILSNQPSKIGGVDCFKLEYTFNNDRFVKYKGIIYGFVLDRRYYQVEFVATQQHYYDGTIKDFEDFIGSFLINTQK